jgi:hypothetical protein
MNEILKETILSVITLFTIILSGCITKIITLKINELSNKTKNEKKLEFLAWVNNIVVQCVDTTTQTYVESLKNSNSFDKEAQKEAFDKTMTNITNLLSDADTQILTNYVGDVSTWLTTAIESYIQESKKR